MANFRNKPGIREDAPAPKPAPSRSPAAPTSGQEEDLSQGNIGIRSIAYMEEFRFSVQGKPYDEWMPRIARSDDGLVPCLPCVDLDTGEECLLILPGLFNSWLRRNNPAPGTKLLLKRKGKDPETGAWKLTVTRL